MGWLGQLDPACAKALQVNGSRTAGGSLAVDAANTDAVPRAWSDTGLIGEARVWTPKGAIAVKHLAPGDTVLDAAGGTATVRHVLRSPKTRKAICLRAPYFGLDHDIVLGADHRIAVTSDVADYLFGAETVLVPAWVLKDGRRAQHWEMLPRTDLYQVQLDRPAALKIGTCAVESMPKSGQSVGKLLTEEQARCFAVEHRSGFQT